MIVKKERNKLENLRIVKKMKEDGNECEDILLRGLNEESKKIKKFDPIISFCFSLENEENQILGGINGISYYGCLYIDMLWINNSLREKGWGTKLMQEAEAFGKNSNCSFSTVNTMDWEALGFYQKLGYEIEFIRNGFREDCKMFFLRKNFNH